MMDTSEAMSHADMEFYMSDDVFHSTAEVIWR